MKPFTLDELEELEDALYWSNKSTLELMENYHYKSQEFIRMEKTIEERKALQRKIQDMIKEMENGNRLFLHSLLVK